MNKVTDYVTKKPKLIILISLLLLIPTALSYLITDVNYDILSYLPGYLDSVKGEKILSDTFEAGTFTMVVVDTDMPVYKISEAKEKISQVENVATTLWVNDFLNESVPADILPDTVKDIFYSQDNGYTLMFVLFDTDCSSKDKLKTVNEIKNVTAEYCNEKGERLINLSGLTPISADTRALSNKEIPVYISVGIALALIIMLVTMESTLMPFIIVLVLGMAVVYNMGTNLLLGSVSYITQCIAAILQLGVTMDYSIFLVNRYGEERKLGGTKEDAMKRALNASMTSLKGSSLTTLFGFLALCFMQLKLGFNIGIVMAKGVILGVAAVIVILPAFILVFDKKIYSHSHKIFVPDFSKAVDFTIRNKKKFTVIFLIVLIPAILLAANVKKYYNLTETLPDDMDSVKALRITKDEFNMTTSHFIVADDSLSSDQLVEMETRIQQVDGIENLIAYNLFVGTSVPDSSMPDELINLIKRDGHQIMLATSVYDAATDESNRQVEEINKIIGEYSKENYLTGEGAMYNDMIGVTRIDFTVTSIVSILAIFILIAVIFKSFSIPAILIASIELAILINEAISTIFGAEIPFIAPTVISCVQLGATVDYAILLTSRFREEIANGYDRVSAIQRAANKSMRSIFQSSMIFFFVTFGVYVISRIEVVKEVCALLARGSLISALIILFFLTPVLLICENFISRTSRDWDKKKESQPAVIQDNTAFTFIDDDEGSFTEFNFSDDD